MLLNLARHMRSLPDQKPNIVELGLQSLFGVGQKFSLRSRAPQGPARIPNRTSDPSCEEHDESGIKEGCCRSDSALEVLGQTAVAAEPSEEALDHPAFWLDGKADLTDLLGTISTTILVAFAARRAASALSAKTRSMNGNSQRDACSNGMAPSRSLG
jgi:hypothetical protein